MAADDITEDITAQTAASLGLLDHETAARRLGLTPRSLTVIRSTGKGPRAVRLGRSVYYRPSDLAAYEAKRRPRPSACKPRAKVPA